MRKILDIIPPKSGQDQSKKVTVTVAPPLRNRSQGSRPAFKLTVPILIGAGIILIGFSAYIFIKPKVEIEIRPVKEKIELQTETNSIPTEVFGTEKNLSGEFTATGLRQKAEKAHGAIRIYNNYSSSPQTLIASTRFISSDGKLFRTPTKVTVPGTPNTIDIEVVADQPGEEYNIGPSTFSIPGFAGTPKYTSFYAKSFEPMTGGIKREVVYVMQEDLDKAEKALKEKVLQECKISLKAAVPQTYIYLEEALDCQIKGFSSSSKAGQEADKFVSQVKTEGRILAFKKSDLADFAKNHIKSQAAAGKEVNENSLETEYDAKTIDLKTEKITLSLKIWGEIFTAPDQSGIKETIKGKTVEETKAIIGALPETTSSRAKLWPFWAKRIPLDLERIKIKIILD